MADATKPNVQPKLRMLCTTCGSENVYRDAWAGWDQDRQKWVLANVFDAAFCPECECDTNIEEKLI